MRGFRFAATLAVLIFVFGFLLSGRTQAKDSTLKISGSLSETTVGTPFDFDNDGTTGTSAIGTGGGKQNVGGAFTTQVIEEGDPEPGTGCALLPTTQAGCTIDGVNDGCLTNIFGGVGAFRFNSDGDISSFQVTGGTTCIDLNSSSGFAPP